MSTEQPIILLTNDDGIHAEGLRYLRLAAEKIGLVKIVAPEAEQSAVGHSITLYDPVKAHEIKKDGVFYGYGISGTPADSVKLALYSLLDAPPKLVLSGINNGANLGINVLYSGTVSAATEAAILGFPAIAFSIARQKTPHYEWTVPHIEMLSTWVLANGLPPGVALSVNMPHLPPEKINGYKVTRQSLAKYREWFHQREDPRGNIYYWLAGESSCDERDENLDINAVAKGYVSITPLFYDLTAHRYLSDIEQCMKKI